ncbi:zinc ribbon domain-containing protein [Desulfatiferula olefinivorans]
MPIYEYQCEACGHTFDALILSSRDPEPTCPRCNHAGVKKLMSAGNILGKRPSSGASPGLTTGGCAPSGG